MRRVTLVDVAKKAGVSRSTASRALAHAPTCAKATIEKVERAAAALNYKPDPALSALINHRDAKRVKNQLQMSIGIPGKMLNRNGRKGLYHAELARSIELAVLKKGFGVEWLPSDQEVSPRQMDQMARSRGVRGFIWSWLKEDAYLGEFPWSKYSHVGLILPLVRPLIHRVRDDSFRTVMDAMEEAKKMGFRRPALALATEQGSEKDRFDIAGYLLACHELGFEPIPFYRRDPHHTPSIRAWLNSARPDVVIGTSDGLFWQMTNGGIQIPEEVSFINLLEPDITGSGRFPGFDPQTNQIGEALVDILERQIRHNELGFTKEPMTLLVRRKWIGYGKKPSES